MNLTVVYLVLASNTRVEREFHSYYACRQFVNKLRHSKKVRLLSYPNLAC